MLQQAGTALSQALGKVEDFIEQGATIRGLTCLPFYTLLPLRTNVNELSAAVMKVLLGSEELQLRSENDAYYLLCAWLSQSRRLSEEDDRQALFKQLLPQLRFQHMSHDFLCSVVSACPYANVSGVQSYIIRCSHALRNASRAFAEERDADVSSKNRSRGSLKCIFDGEFELAVLLSDYGRSNACKYIGLAVSFPVAIYVEHEAEDTLGVYAHVGMPSAQGYDIKGGIKRSAGF